MAGVQADADAGMVFKRDQVEQGAKFGDRGADGCAVAAGVFEDGDYGFGGLERGDEGCGDAGEGG